MEIQEKDGRAFMRLFKVAGDLALKLAMGQASKRRIITLIAISALAVEQSQTVILRQDHS